MKAVKNACLAVGTGVAALVIPLTPPLAAGPEKLPAELFARDFGFEAMRISPDGTHLAYTFSRDGGTNLAVLDLPPHSALQLTQYKAPNRVDWFRWQSPQRIFMRTVRKNTQYEQIPINALVESDGSKGLLLNYNPTLDGYYIPEKLVALNPADPDTVLISSSAERHGFPTVYKVNIRRSGPRESRWPTERTRLFDPPGPDCDYLADNAAVVRICVTQETDNTRRLLYRDGEKAPWKELERFAPGTDPLRPIAFTDDNRQLYVLSVAGRNTRGLFLYDPQHAARGELVYGTDTASIDEVVFSDDGLRPLAVTFFNGAKNIHYLEPKAEEIHLAVAAALPGMQIRLASMTPDMGKGLILARSARTPGTYYLYGTAERSLQKLVDVAEWIDAEKMGTVRRFSLTDATPPQTRKIFAALTLPRGAAAKNLPLIVYLHSGSSDVRDPLDFDLHSQFFANRGYAVLRIDVGSSFTEASNSVSGNSVLGGIQALAAEGTIDPSRVGVFGADPYGGYLALAMLMKNPEALKCAMVYGGLTDLEGPIRDRRLETLNGLSRNYSPAEHRFWKQVAGGSEDKAVLRSLSPAYNAGRFTAPILLIHGGDDIYAPAADARALAKALRRAGTPVELFVEEKEAHEFQIEAHRAELYRRLDAFLDRYFPAASPAT